MWGFISTDIQASLSPRTDQAYFLAKEKTHLVFNFDRSRDSRQQSSCWCIFRVEETLFASTEKGSKFAAGSRPSRLSPYPLPLFRRGQRRRKIPSLSPKKYILHTRHEQKKSRVEYNQNHRHVWRHWRIVSREPAVAKGPLELLGARLARVQFEVVPKVVAP